MFTAFSFAILDPDAGMIQWSNAAQPHPLIKRGNGASEAEEDGMYGTERLMNLVGGIDSSASAGDVIGTILRDVADFVGSAEQYDDMTVVVVRRV